MVGIKVFDGIGIGATLVYEEINVESLVTEATISPLDADKEVAKFEEICKKAEKEMLALKEHAMATVADEAEIIDAHLMMLEDPMLYDGVVSSIKNDSFDVDNAIVITRNSLVDQMKMIDNEYIRARIKDIYDVTDRMLRISLGVEATDFDQIKQPTVLIANDLKPSETVMLNDYIVGIILEEGSVTSHAAIVAKAKGIPTVVGVKDACSKIESGKAIILDATACEYFVEPDENLKAQYEKNLEYQKEEKQRLDSLKGLEATTIDGHTIKLFGNVGSVQEAEWVKDAGSKGIGLLRTELLYMDNDLFPTEEQQLEYYKAIASQMEEETIIRTLDIGGDKHLPYYQFKEEANPFLGERAIRFCLKNDEIFMIQLRAILRASSFGKIKIMFPMIGALEELLQAKELLEKAKGQLREEGLSFDENIEVGMMIEIPAAAIAAHVFAKEVDFFSIGTNDLCQYTSAVDRMNPTVAHLYQPLHPAILRLIKTVVDAAKKENVEVGVCGETAGDLDYAVVLLGLGVDELSMSASMINRVKDRIRNITFKKAFEITEKVFETVTADEAAGVLKGELN